MNVLKKNNKKRGLLVALMLLVGVVITLTIQADVPLNTTVQADFHDNARAHNDGSKKDNNRPVLLPGKEGLEQAKKRPVGYIVGLVDPESARRLKIAYGVYQKRIKEGWSQEYALNDYVQEIDTIMQLEQAQEPWSIMAPIPNLYKGVVNGNFYQFGKGIAGLGVYVMLFWGVKWFINFVQEEVVSEGGHAREAGENENWWERQRREQDERWREQDEGARRRQEELDRIVREARERNERVQREARERTDRWRREQGEGARRRQEEWDRILREMRERNERIQRETRAAREQMERRERDQREARENVRRRGDNNRAWEGFNMGRENWGEGLRREQDEGQRMQEELDRLLREARERAERIQREARERAEREARENARRRGDGNRAWEDFFRGARADDNGEAPPPANGVPQDGVRYENSHYATLGIERPASLADITDANIRRAHLQRVRELHPDRNHAPDATARMQEANAAHDVLRDRRALYDATVIL